MNEAANLRAKSLVPGPIREFFSTIIKHDKAACRLIEDVTHLPKAAKLQVEMEIRGVGWVRQLPTVVPIVDTVANLLTSGKVCNANEVQLFCDVLFAAQTMGVINFGDYPIEFTGEEAIEHILAERCDGVEHDWTELTDVTAMLFSKWIHDACRADTNLFTMVLTLFRFHSSVFHDTIRFRRGSAHRP